MMQAPEILSRIQYGADSVTQFKVDMTDANFLAEELVAFCWQQLVVAATRINHYQ